MPDSRGPLAAFDDETFDAVAADAAVESGRLRSLVERHQQAVRDLPGVEDIVYEWRSQFHEDPLVSRSEAAYVLAHRSHVWDEFAADLDLDESEERALMAVHDRQARSLVGEGSTARLDGADPMVLTRP